MAKHYKNENLPEIDPQTCRYCRGYSNARKPGGGGRYTSDEFCTEFDVCAATINWRELFPRRSKPEESQQSQPEGSGN